jgi:hypothetical protein
VRRRGAGPGGLHDIEPVALPRTQGSLPDVLSYELLARRPDLQALRWYVQASFARIDAVLFDQRIVFTALWMKLVGCLTPRALLSASIGWS